MLRKNKNKVFYILGIVFILIGLFILISTVLIIDKTEFRSKNITYNIDKGNIKNNFKIITTHVDYKTILYIPKIGLTKELYDINSNKNNVNKNIQVMKESTMPDTVNGNLILASHSGNSKISYFKNLDQLIIGDKAYINYKNKKYNYELIDRYSEEKDGSIDIITNKNETNLTLITCDKNDKRYQLVFIFKLIN